jgi:hypothetical protein
MGLNNAEKQAAHRARLRAKGLVHVQAWATPAQAAAIRAILSGEAAAVPASRPAAPPPLPLAKLTPPRRSRKKKLTTAELERLQVTERNRDIMRQHQADVDRMEAGRVSRSTLRAWLEERGADFGGKTTELNALLGPRSARA